MVELGLLFAALLALPLSMLLLARYRRAVVAAMGPAVPVATPAPRAGGGRGLHAPMLEVPARVPRRPFGDASRRPALACLPAGAAYAAVMACGLWLGDAQLHGGWRQWLALAWIYSWPTVVALALAGTADGRGRLALFAGYGVSYLAVLLPVAAVQGVGAALPLWGSWALVNTGGTLLVAAVSMRRVRSAGPLVLVVLLVPAFVAQGALLAAKLRVPGWPDGAGDFVAMLLGLGVGALACRPVLRWLARRHAARSFSDASLLKDALFGIFAVTHTVGPAASDGRWYLLGLAAFCAYRGTLALSYRAWVRPVQPQSLLLLRVFRLGRRSEALFDRLRRQWLPLGPLRMVAGPDLAAAAAAPHELLDWLAGKLQTHFIGDAAALDRRLQRLQEGPDPDGRHRVDSLFCRDGLWRDAVLRLAARSDAVLMDLRCYGRGNDGCAWEIEQLLRHVPLNRVLFLLDARTDRALLQATLDTVAAALDPTSPNAGWRCGPVRVMSVDTPGDRSAEAICRALLDRRPRLASSPRMLPCPPPPPAAGCAPCAAPARARGC